MPTHADLMRITIEVVIFSIIQDQLCILLTQRATPPYESMRCLPWWFMNEQEDALAAARRILYKETWIYQYKLEQIWYYTSLDRDPRRRSVWLAQTALIPTPKPTQKWATQLAANRISINHLPVLAFDHHDIVLHAYHKLQHNSIHQTLQQLLPAEFTLAQLQHYYHIITQTVIDKRNFRKHIVPHYHLKATKHKEQWVNHRPAQLWKF